MKAIVRQDAHRSPSRMDSRKNDSPPPITTIRQIADRTPSLFDTNILALSNQNIIQIGLLREPAYEIEQLNLSKNALQDLRGIEQFPNLRKLDLSDNWIKDIHNVFYLKGLPKLENLNLSDNGVIIQPNFKETLLSMIPTLRYLNTREIKRSDYEAIDPNLRKEYALLEVMLQNYCELMKLQSAVKRMDLHKELVQKDKRFLINRSTFSVKKFRKMYQYIEQLDEKVKNDYRVDLLRDLRVIQENLLKRIDIDAAAHELITRQQAKINELSKIIDKKANILDTIKNQNASRFLKNDREQDLVIESLPRAHSASKLEMSTPIKGLTERESFYKTDSKENEIRDSFNTSSRSIPTVRRIHKSDLGQKIATTTKKSFSPKRSISPQRSLSPQNSLSTHRSLPQNRDTSLYRPSPRLSPIHTIYKTAHSESPQTTRTSYKRTKGQGTSTSLKLTQDDKQLKSTDRSPSKESLSTFQYSPRTRPTIQHFELPAEKDRKIENLSRVLKQKIEQVLRAEDSNRELTERMRKLQDYSDLNSRIAKEEYQMILKELDRIENYKNSLANEISVFQNQLDQIKSRANYLEIENRALKEESLKAKYYAKELAMLQTIDDKMEIAERYHSDKITLKTFKLLRLAVLKSEAINSLRLKNEKKKNKKLVEISFRNIQRSMILSKILKIRDLERDRNFCGDVLYTWKLNARFSKRYQHLIKERNRDLAVRAFKFWKNYTSTREEKKRNYMKIDQYYREFMLKAAFVAFKNNHRLYNYSAIDSKKREREAMNYNRIRNKRYFFAVWRHCIYHVIMPKRLKQEQAASLYIKNLLTMGLKLLKGNINFYKNAETQADLMFKQNQIQLVSDCFNSWKEDFHSHVSFKRKLNALKDKYNLCRRWNIWREAFRSSQYYKKVDRTAEIHYLMSIKKKIFNMLLKVKILRQQRRNLFYSYEAHRISNEKRQAFYAWKYAMAKRIEHYRQSEAARIRLLGNIFNAWRQRNAYTFAKKTKLIRANYQHKKAIKKLKRNIFSLLKDRAAHAKRLFSIENTISERQKLSSIRFYFNILSGELRQSLRRKIARLIDERDTAINKAKENLEYGNRADEDRINLMEKLEVCSKTINGLRSENEHQTERINSLNAELEAKRRQEEWLASEMRMKDDVINKLGLDLDEAHQMILDRDQEIENLMHQHRDNRQDLQAQIENLRIENDSKQRLIIELEAALGKRTEEHNQYVQTTDTKLHQLSIDNSDLQQEINQKDTELQEVLNVLDQYIKKNEELKVQLKNSLDSMVEASAKYENKFSELHIRNTQLEGENEQIKRSNKQIQAELIELRSLLRKYEYEVELMTAQQHDETDQFINNLHKNKYKADNLQRQPQENGHSYGLETSQSATRLDRFQTTTSLFSFDKGRKSAILDRPIQELQAHLVSKDKTRASQKAILRPTSPDQVYSNRQEVYLPTEPAYTYRDRRNSPIDTENFNPKSSKASLLSSRNKKEKNTDTTDFSSKSTIKSIQQEVEKFKVFKSQIKDNMTQRNKAFKQKIFS